MGLLMYSYHSEASLLRSQYILLDILDTLTKMIWDLSYTVKNVVYEVIFRLLKRSELSDLYLLGRFSFTHSLIHSFTHSLIHSFTHSLIHSFTHSLIHSFTHSLIHSFTPSLLHSFTHSLFHSFTPSLFLIHSLIGFDPAKKTAPRQEDIELASNLRRVLLRALHDVLQRVRSHPI